MVVEALVAAEMEAEVTGAEAMVAVGMVVVVVEVVAKVRVGAAWVMGS